ncbi:hypothetical protein WICMUC_000074 [Wickerhamomyces mucosus]|uniref:Condensin complex subunit 2 n=1 Tax=Wickerhamomyces mucosus TaxID=1378264 RepID=A0A9P8TJT3_9ASCO|nr:hypothetical protein WICMUC_000074 [Wickerhamomyces mucosus]
MAYVKSKVMKKRLDDKRRVSGAALLREELASDSITASLLDDIPAFQHDKGKMMANFEEWIKMATDNKINTTNSWNFGLIDYFHDMNVLRGIDNNINFQKASATLDGCVKIYSSRVDSVVTETGRLLSGLAQRKANENNNKVGNKDGYNDDNDDNDDDDEDDDVENQDIDADENGDLIDPSQQKKKKNKSKSRQLGDTLTTFDNLKIKKLSQELAIDPLFKKTLSEFDEGGAKSLLLNTLNLDKDFRVIFDASTTNGNDDDELSNNDNVDNKEQNDGKVQDGSIDEDKDVNMTSSDSVIDITGLKAFIFQDDVPLESTTLCPSFQQLQSVLKDISKAKSILNDFNQDLVNHTTNSSIGDKNQLNSRGKFDDDDGFDFDFGGAGQEDFDVGVSFDDVDNNGIAKAIIFQDELNENQQEVNADESNIIASVVDQDLMAYFDHTLKRNWAGPEHWKVRQLKKDNQRQIDVQNQQQSENKNKKVKQDFTIDFTTLLDDDEEERIFTKSKISTMLPQPTGNERHNNYLLPDDIFFSSEQLTKLFLKPHQKLSVFRKFKHIRSIDNKDANNNNNFGSNFDSQIPPLNEDIQPVKDNDATFWAENYKEQEIAKGFPDNNDNDNDDDNNNPFFENNDVDLGFDGDFGDNSLTTDTQKFAMGTQLITGGNKVKPEYVNYSKTAKNVNVKVLKDNIWKVLDSKIQEDEKEVKVQEGNPIVKEESQLTDVVKDIEKFYPKDQRKDLSTSFCFICLLHLANEHSLTLENNELLNDIKITSAAN